MKIIQVVPKPTIDSNLKTLLKNKERELRGRPTAFHREREGKWKHIKHPGWITWDTTRGGLLVAEVHTKKGCSDWQLLQAFVGYLDRHLGENIESVTVYYR